MKRIAFVFPPLLPLPAVRGGASETLIQRLIDDNENRGECLFHVFCRYDQEAENCSKRYKYTQFSYIKERETLVDHVAFLWYRLRRKISKNYVPEPYIKALTAKINKEIYDAVIVESSFRFIPYLKKKTNNKVMLHLHFDAVASKQKALEEGLRLCDGVVCVSHFIEKTIHNYDSSIPTYVLPNVTDVSRFDAGKYAKPVAEIKEKLGIENEPVILYSGRLAPLKGVLELVQAYKLALKQVPQMKMILAGSAGYGETTQDEYYDMLIEQIGDMKDKSIFLTGYVNHDQMPVYYALADVAVLPTTMVDEAAPLSVLEAQASGCYFIGSDSGAIPELMSPDYGSIVHRGEEYVKNLAEQLVLAAQRYRRIDYSQPTAGRLFVLKYHDGEKYFENFLQLMKKILRSDI